MAGLRKHILYGLFDNALHASGWQGLMLPPVTAFPARYQLFQGSVSVAVSLYIWTISHGGGAKRAAAEYRIQLTGGGGDLLKFEPEPGGKTLILGWWPEVEVFAGFDYNYHDGGFGKSPSIQVGEDALRLAATNGMAIYVRGNGEIVIAFRPEFLGAYVAQKDELHRVGLSEREVALLRRIAADPAAVPDTEIEAETAAAPQRLMVNVRRTLRAYRFSNRVLKAYEHRCAFCGMQLRLLDAAHILPVAHPKGVDGTANGVAVCTLHHRAYDNALITFDEGYQVRLDEDDIREMEQEGLADGLTQFRQNLRQQILLPSNPDDRPTPVNIREANKYRGWW